MKNPQTCCDTPTTLCDTYAYCSRCGKTWHEEAKYAQNDTGGPDSDYKKTEPFDLEPTKEGNITPQDEHFDAFWRMGHGISSIPEILLEHGFEQAGVGYTNASYRISQHDGEWYLQDPGGYEEPVFLPNLTPENLPTLLHILGIEES